MDKDITSDVALKNSIFRIGFVFSVEGREVRVKVDKSKNASHLLFQGDLIKNVSVGSYLRITKGYISIIGKVEGEYVKEDNGLNNEYNKEENKIDRVLKIKLLGYIESSKFERGIKELPLIGNECYLIDKTEFESIHNFVKGNDVSLKIGTLNLEPSQNIRVGINGLFASHIGIFGNTGSGKSYTLAKVYRELFLKAGNLSMFKSNAKFLLFDFNGEYNSERTSLMLTLFLLWQMLQKKLNNLSLKEPFPITKAYMRKMIILNTLRIYYGVG
jgi:hypothetical protein